MLNTSAKEVDVEMTEYNSDESDDYGIGKFIDDDSLSYSIHSSKTSSVDDMTGNTPGQKALNHSFYTQSELEHTKLEQTLTGRCNDYFDPDEMYKLLNVVGNTGDKVDSDDSSRTCVENPFVLDHLDQQTVFKPRLNGRDLKIFNKTFYNSVSSSNEHLDCAKSKKPMILRTSVCGARKNTSKLSNMNNPSDMESITLMIKVPKSKLLSHIKDMTQHEYGRSLISKPTSSCTLNDVTKSQPSANTIRLKNDEFNVSSPENKATEMNSLSDITSYIDQSKKLIKNYKETMKMSQPNLKTHTFYKRMASEKSEKETQTVLNTVVLPPSGNSTTSHYFLCNICHKIVPANLSPICMKLSCSAVTKCDLIFHSELDMIMHLPVKHTLEFESYKICIKCNLMFHPSNTVDIKGCCTCLDCLAMLVQLANK